MQSKICSHCKEEKDFSFFSSNKRNPDGKQNECKQCNKDKLNKKIRTKDGFVSFTYKVQKQSSRKRGHRLPEYTEDELYEWLYSQTLFHELFSEWKLSGYNKWLKPSVDRKYNDIHYCINNIQLMTWQENDNKERVKEKAGDSKRCKSISQYTIDGIFINSFKSAKIASNTTGINYGNIKGCASNLKPNAGGFVWVYR